MCNTGKASSLLRQKPKSYLSNFFSLGRDKGQRTKRTKNYVGMEKMELESKQWKSATYNTFRIQLLKGCRELLPPLLLFVGECNFPWVFRMGKRLRTIPLKL